MIDERKVSWFGLLLRLVFVVFVVFCVSEVLGEAGRGQSVCHLTHLQPPYLFDGLLSACCQITIASCSWYMVNSNVSSVFSL